MIWEIIESRSDKGGSLFSGKKRSFAACKASLEVV